MVIILNLNKLFISIRWKLVSTYLILIIICLAFTGSFIGEIVKSNTINVKKEHLVNQGNILADRILSSNYKKNTKLEDSIDQLVDISSKEIGSRVIILNEQGVVISDSYEEDSGKKLTYEEIYTAIQGETVANEHLINDKEKILFIAVPIAKNNNVYGVVFISSSLEEVEYKVNEIMKRYLVFSIMIILIATLISLLFAHYIASPIEKLTYSINKIYHGNMEQKVEIIGNDELTNLGKAFNLMSTRLYQVDKQRRDFVASVSHELRTPLSAIKILSESLLLQKDAKIYTYREFLVDIDSEVMRLNNIIEDLLSLVDMDKEKLQLDIEKKNLNSLVRGLIHSLNPLAQNKSIKINFHNTEDIEINLDQLKIEQAIINVISNAIKYTPEGGIIDIWIYSKQDSAVIKIKDNGIGIPEESIPYIFDKFYRVDKARSRSTGGTGLGLSITKQIIELHQGRINVESTINKGTTFYISLPGDIF